jgi:hypothetical protein
VRPEARADLVEIGIVHLDRLTCLQTLEKLCLQLFTLDALLISSDQAAKILAVAGEVPGRHPLIHQFLQVFGEGYVQRRQGWLLVRPQ